MNARITSIGLLFIAFLLPASGCGGGEGDDPLTVAQLVRRANSICETAGKRQFAKFGKSLERKTGSSTEPASQAQLEEATVEAVLPEARRMISELEDLEPPPAAEGKYDSVISKLKMGLKKAEDSPRLFLSGKAFAAAGKEANDLNLENCNL